MSRPRVTIDYMQVDLDGTITVETAELPAGLRAHDHLVVGDHEAKPAVARVLEVRGDRALLRVLPGSLDDHADLLDQPAPHAAP